MKLIKKNKIVTPAEKNQYVTPCIFFAGQRVTKGGLWEKAKIFSRGYKTIRNQTMYIKFATIRRTKLVKVTHVVEAEKSFRQKLRALKLTKKNLLRKEEFPHV